MVEASCFGAKKIADRFISEGIPINGVIALGGIAKKSSFVMQTMADVLNAPIKVAQSEQACALGAAVFGAVAANLYDDTSTAMQAMASEFEITYQPIAENVKAYAAVYERYNALGVTIENLIMNS